MNTKKGEHFGIFLAAFTFRFLAGLERSTSFFMAVVRTLHSFQARVQI